MNQVVVALGGNVGDVSKTFDAALKTLAEHPQIRELQSAGLFSSAPMGEHSGDQFLNSACRFATSLAPLELLDLLQSIENDSGRKRTLHCGPRTLDLDLIFYGDEIIHSDRLTVPHPHCWYRRFVLDPVVSLIADYKHPVQRLTLAELQRRLLRKPFRLLFSGSFNEAVLSCASREFANIEVEHVENADSTAIESASLGIRIDEDSASESAPLWLSCRTVTATQTIRDALTAATDGVSPVIPWPQKRWMIDMR